MYSAFVAGEILQFHDRDGVWQWGEWPLVPADAPSFATAAEAALNALATQLSRAIFSRAAFRDVLLGIVEASEGMTSPELERARDLLKRSGSGVGSPSFLQRKLLRELGMTHRDGMLLERRTFGRGLDEFLLVEMRSGALPPVEARPSHVGDGAALLYTSAPPRPDLSGEAEWTIVRSAEGNYGYADGLNGTAATPPRFFRVGEAALAAVDDARSRGIACLTLKGEWIHDGAVDYGRAYGMDVRFGGTGTVLKVA